MDGTSVNQVVNYIQSAFDYRGVRVNIQHPFELQKYWSYSIKLELDRFEDAGVRNDLWLPSVRTPSGRQWDLQRSQLLHLLYWHGGRPTCYYKWTSPDGRRIIAAGCHYGHEFDAGRNYTLADIIADAKRTVDSLYEYTFYSCAEEVGADV